MKGTFAVNWIHKCDGMRKSSIFWKLSKVKCIRFTLSHLIQTRWTKNSFKWIKTRNCHSGFRLLFIMPKPYGARPSWFGFFFKEKKLQMMKKKNVNLMYHLFYINPHLFGHFAVFQKFYFLFNALCLFFLSLSSSLFSFFASFFS